MTNYQEAVNEMTDALLNEDVHDYLKKLAKKGIKKIGTSDFKNVLAKYGDAKEKEIFAKQDYSGKSIDLGSLFGGISKGIHGRVAKEREAHPYRIVQQTVNEDMFPSTVGHISNDGKRALDTPEKRKARQDKLFFRRDREIKRIGDAFELNPEVKELRGKYAAEMADVHKHMDVIHAKESEHEDAFAVKRNALSDEYHDLLQKSVVPLQKAFDAATEERVKASRAYDEHPDNAELQKTNPAAHEAKRREHLKPLLDLEGEAWDTVTAAQNEHADKHQAAQTKLWREHSLSRDALSTETQKYYDANVRPPHDRAYDLMTQIDRHQGNMWRKKDNVHRRYNALLGASEGSETPLEFENYTEHVAQADKPIKWKNRNPRVPFGTESRDGEPSENGGHWENLRGTTEFDVITSDLHHPKLGKTLFVHEIQSDLHQKTKNDSPIGKTWREHALTHVHKTAHEGGYEHVMFAPASVQFVNNGGRATAVDIAAALHGASDEQKAQVHSEVGSLEPTAIESMMKSSAGGVAKRYHEEVFPTANKVFGHEPELHQMSYRRDRGSGEAERHDFPVYKVEKNIAKVEEEFQAYMRHNALVEDVTDKLLGDL